MVENPNRMSNTGGNSLANAILLFPPQKQVLFASSHKTGPVANFLRISRLVDSQG